MEGGLVGDPDGRGLVGDHDHDGRGLGRGS